MNVVTTFAPYEKVEIVSHFEFDNLRKQYKKCAKSKKEESLSDYGNVTIFYGADNGRKVIYEKESNRLTIPGREGKSVVLEGRVHKVDHSKLHEIRNNIDRHRFPFHDSEYGPIGPYRKYDVGRGSYVIVEKYFERISLFTFDEQEAKIREREMGILN